MWIAEGFVKREEEKRIEDVAEGYLKDLIFRSLVTVVQQASTGGVKLCRIHDLLHEFCLQKAKEERFFYVLEENDDVLEFQSPQNLRRLGIYSDPKYLIRSTKFFPFVRSLFFNDYAYACSFDLLRSSFQVFSIVPFDLSSMVRMCKRLRVLDLGRINLGHRFPSEIGLLEELTFLAVRGQMSEIPTSIGDLSNLETFILRRMRCTRMLSLPNNIWNLRKLGYLYLSSPGGIFPKDTSDLCEMDRISGVAIRYGDNMEELMRKFPNIRRLKCFFLDFHLHEATGNCVKIVVPEFLNQLESLSLSLPLNFIPMAIMFDFGFPANLKKLTLSWLNLSRGSLATISKLSSLEVLKFVSVRFEGDTWTMEEEENFSKLRILVLSSSTLISWIASDDQFESLEKLELCSCECLEEIPDFLETIGTLQEIRVIEGSSFVQESAKQIEKTQKENGNVELKRFTS